MLFLGAMSLIVLPLFLLICISMIRKSSFAHRPAGLILETIFLASIALSITGLVFFIVQIIKSF